ncbi:Hypothetical predicted protein [Octopus vulgaris]|uniref:Uncharacterized protein n=1 Tax=Octopus vulgaris TaxID=6645 RepID=A0AA36ALY8_OCTVU|nr:Hypothetical predicted protein [Octopus vulgaris]
MPLERRLTATEKTQIVAGLTESLCVGELAQELGRDTRTLKAHVKNPITKPRQHKGTRSVSQRDIRKIGPEPI